MEANLLQRGLEQCCVFETIPAAPRMNQLFLDRGKIEPDGPAEQHVEIFERDGGLMRLMQVGEARGVDPKRPVMGDAGQIGVEIARISS